MIRAHIFKLMLALAIGIVACAGIKDTSANDSYDDIIKYRQQVMIANAAHITAIFSVINGKTDFVEQIAAHAASISQSAKYLLETYPSGSDVGRTDAKLEIWENWDKFVTSAELLEQTASELAATVNSGDMQIMKRQAEAIGKACSGCHSSFRKKR